MEKFKCYGAAFLCFTLQWGGLTLLAALPLSGCSTAQLATAAPYVQAGNTAGAIIAGIVQPAIAIPAGIVAGTLNGAITTATGQ